jgi:DNA-directed RNA polymerase specialized sigma24 family protein
MSTKSKYTTLHLELQALSATRAPRVTVDRLRRSGLPIGPRATLEDVVRAVAGEASGRETIVRRLLALERAHGDLSVAILVALHPTLLGFSNRIGGASGATEDEQADVLVAAWTAIAEEVGRLEPDPARLIQRAWDLSRATVRWRRDRAMREAPGNVCEILDMRAGRVVEEHAPAKLLDLAVASGAVSVGDAELVELTRVAGVTLAELSRATGIPRTTLAARRTGAERVLCRMSR